MPDADLGKVVAAVVLSAVALWMSFKAGQMALAATRKAALFSKDWVIDVTSKIDSVLNTPVKRLGACITVVGAASLAIGVVQIAIYARYLDDALSYFLLSAVWLFSSDDSYLVFKAVSYGGPMTVVGLAFSFFYDVGVGKVIGWILHGQGNQRVRKT